MHSGKFNRGISAAALLAAMLTAGSVSPAFAEDPSPSPYQWYVDQGVSPEVAQELVDDFDAGILPNSLDGSEPLSSETFDEDGWEVTRSTFADGSVSISKLELPDLGSKGAFVANASVGGCTSTSSGSGYVSYYQCAVWGENAYLALSFRADYTRTSTGVGIINAVISPYQSAHGGTAPTPTLAITRTSGSGTSTPATARATTQYSSATASFTARLYLMVNGSTAWSTQNF